MGAAWEWSGRWGGAIALALMCVVVCWNLAQGVCHRRKLARMAKPSKETQPQPLVSDDKMAALRHGDTVLLLLSLDEMTVDQQTRFVDSVKKMIEPAQARGIEFIITPDWKQKAIVVSRSATKEQAGDKEQRKATTEWLAQAYKKWRERDEAMLAELRNRVDALNQESVGATLREARLQWGKSLEPLIQGLLKKAQALQGSQLEPAGVQALLEDVRALSEAVSKTP